MRLSPIIITMQRIKVHVTNTFCEVPHQVFDELSNFTVLYSKQFP
jgi:hypothetical protein